MLDDAAPWGVRAYTKEIFLDERSDPAIAVLAAHLPAKSLTDEHRGHRWRLRRCTPRGHRVRRAPLDPVRHRHRRRGLGLGLLVNLKRVTRLMREAGVQGLYRRRRRGCAVRDPDAHASSDLVNRNFTADEPNRL
jgi:hypothetical protein